MTKAFYTPEEAAAIEQGRGVRETAQTTPGTIPDVHYDFTQFGLDRSQSTFARNLRTSMIVDPPDGRIPPVNAEGGQRIGGRRATRAAGSTTPRRTSPSAPAASSWGAPGRR